MRPQLRLWIAEEYGYCAADAWEKRKEPRRSLGQDKRAIMQRSCSEGLIGEWTGMLLFRLASLYSTPLAALNGVMVHPEMRARLS